MSMAIPWKNWSTSMDIHSCASWFSTFSVFFAVPSLPILFLAMTYQYIQWFQSRCRKPQDVFEMGVHINHLFGVCVIHSETIVTEGIRRDPLYGSLRRPPPPGISPSPSTASLPTMTTKRWEVFPGSSHSAAVRIDNI